MSTTSTLVLAYETAISVKWQTCLELVDPLAAGGEELLIICLHVHHLTIVGFVFTVLSIFDPLHAVSQNNDTATIR